MKINLYRQFDNVVKLDVYYRYSIFVNVGCLGVKELFTFSSLNLAVKAYYRYRSMLQDKTNILLFDNETGEHLIWN